MHSKYCSVRISACTCFSTSIKFVSDKSDLKKRTPIAYRSVPILNAIKARAAIKIHPMIMWYEWQQIKINRAFVKCFHDYAQLERRERGTKVTDGHSIEAISDSMDTIRTHRIRYNKTLKNIVYIYSLAWGFLIHLFYQFKFYIRWK